MRIWRGLAALALVVAALSAASVPSSAQSVLQQFFGSGRSEESNSREWRRSPFGFNRYRGGHRSYDYDSRGSDGWQEDYGVYSTMCVRLCDGYYFPLSHGVRRGRLYQDSRKCRRRCDGEARLFYFRTDGGGVETMVDMAGRAYTQLPNAFRYRKALVNGCTCKPAPWSVEAKAMHQSYAAEAAQSKANAEIEKDNRIEREARVAESKRGYDAGYERGYGRDRGPNQDFAPRSRRPKFYSRWQREQQWDEAPIESLYDH